jgi:HSP20 family protein
MALQDSWLSPLAQQLAREVDRLFDELIHRRWGAGRFVVEEWPPLDLYETDAAFILEADLPGVKKEAVSVVIAGGDLVLRGSRRCAYRTTLGTVHCHERREGSFVRRLRLPAAVDPERIHIKLGNGVLRVTLPKDQHTSRARKISR